MHILSRDFMTLKLWDVRVETRPIVVVPIHDHLRAKLCELYENDCIFDKFECALSSSGGKVITGSYDHRVYVHDTNTLNGTAEMQLAAQGAHVLRGTELQNPFPAPGHKVEFEKKSLHVASAPQGSSLIAVGATSAVHIYGYQ